MAKPSFGLIVLWTSTAFFLHIDITYAVKDLLSNKDGSENEQSRTVIGTSAPDPTESERTKAPDPSIDGPPSSNTTKGDGDRGNGVPLKMFPALNEQNVTLGLKNIKSNLKWYDPSIRDGSAIFKFAIKHSYNKECDTPTKFKQKVGQCLPTHDLLLSDNTTECKIIVLGEQWNETYKQLFRNESLLLRKDAHFLTIKTCGDTLAISDFLVFPKSMESSFKFLPYELGHFQHMLDFELSASDHGSSTRHVQLNVMNSCLPNLEKLRNITSNKIISHYNYTCAKGKSDRLITHMFKMYQNTKEGNIENLEESKLSFMKRIKANRRISGSTEHCTLMEDESILCSAVRHLDSFQKHLYMIALYVQVYFLAEYLDGDPDDLQVCLVQYVNPSNLQKWFYGKLTASSTSKTDRFTLVECCRMTRKLKVYDADLDDMNMSWVCHDPYRVANIIMICINIGSYIAALLLPLGIRYFPPLRTPSKCDRPFKTKGLTKKTGLATNVPVIAINDEKQTDDEDNTRHSLLVPEDSRQLTMRRSSSVSSDRSCLEALAAENREVQPDTSPHLAANIEALPKVHQVDPESYIPEHDLLFLDRDPVYSFGLKTLLSLALLFHVDCHALVVIRRFLFLYCVWILVHFASVIVSFYYPSLAIHFQVFYYDFNQRKAYRGNEFYRLFYILVLVVPLCYAVIHFLLLSPLLMRKQSISNSLSWNENQDSISSIVRTDPKIIFYRRSKPSEVSFYLLLLWRLKLLTNGHFWKHLFDNAVFKMPPYLLEDYTDAKTCIRPKGCTRQFLRIIVYFLKAPLVLIVSLFYTIPFFVAHRELLLNAERFVMFNSCISKASKWCVIIMTVASMCLTFLLTLSFTFLYGGMAIFCLVDVVRNIKTNVNHSVLFVSVLLYVQTALVELEDEYREMKYVIFHVCKELDAGITKERCDRPPLMWSSPDGEMAIPRRIFTGVCDILLPYSTSVLHTSLSLILTISFVFFLYVMVIDFQALDQFDGIGQSLMTIFTVSLPRLMFQIQSRPETELYRERMYGKVKATIKDLLDQEDVFMTTRRVSELMARRDTLCEEKINGKRRDTCPAWV